MWNDGIDSVLPGNRERAIGAGRASGSAAPAGRAPLRRGWKLNHQGGDVQEWAQEDGFDPSWAPSWQPKPEIQLVQEFRKPPAPPGKPSPQITKENPGNIPFDACLGLSSPALISNGAGCILGGMTCETVAGCVVAAVPCLAVLGIVSACEAVSQHYAVPSAQDFN